MNCTINFRLSPGETAFIIDDSKPAVFVYDAEIKGMVEKALEMAEHKPRRIVMVDISGEAEAPKVMLRILNMSKITLKIIQQWIVHDIFMMKQQDFILPVQRASQKGCL